MFSVNLLSSVPNYKNYTEMLKAELMPYEPFLGHFYKVLENFLKVGDIEINKVFNLYAVQLKKNKEEVENFRKVYVNSFSQYTKSDNEVGYLYTFLKQNNKEALDFVVKAKRKLLGFYGSSSERMDRALDSLTVRVEDWINLLKSFPFFTSDNLLNKIERFKRHINEENENVLEINGLEFIKSTYNFYLTEKSQTDVINKTNNTIRMTTYSTPSKRPVSYKRKVNNEELTIAKTALKYNRGGTNRPLGHSEGFSKLISAKRTKHGNLQRGQN